MHAHDYQLTPVDSELLAGAYEAMITAVEQARATEGFGPTACHGWSQRDLLHHWWSDVQRALVALGSPSQAPADVDAVSYWQDWTDPDPAGWRYHRVVASMFSRFDQLAEEIVDTARACLFIAAGTPLDTRLRTQGHVMSAADLISTLVVEATIHRLDLASTHGIDRDGPALRHTRSVIDAIAYARAGECWPGDADDVSVIRQATGRTSPDNAPPRLRGVIPLLC